MKSTPIFKILAAVLLAAVVLYFGVQVYHAMSDAMTTTAVYRATVEDTMELSGVLVREEETFHTGSPALAHQLSEGERVGVGQVMAVAYDDASALRTVEQAQTLHLQLGQLQFALMSYLDPDAALKLDSTIQSDILALRATVSGGDYTAAEEELAALKGAVLKRDYTSTSPEQTEADITALETQIDTLESTLHGTPVTAPRNGTYSAVCDGYETVLTPAMLPDITPDALEGARPLTVAADVGKLIYGDTWYYAAVLTDEQAEELAERRTVKLRLSKTATPDTEMTVVSVGESVAGRRVVVLSSRRYVAETTLLRRQTAQLVLRRYTGLHIPANALRVNDEGVSGVYCVIGARARFKPVAVVYQDGLSALVEPADDTSGVELLRQGDEVIVTKDELYDGKVIGAET